MAFQTVQNYVNLVSGVTRASRSKATATAKALLAQSGLEDVANDASERVAKLAEEIHAASHGNRELLENLISAEMDKVATRWGFARAEEVATLRKEIAELRMSLAYAAAQGEPPEPSPTEPSPTEPRPTRTPAQKVAADTSSAKSPAAKSPTKTSPTKRRAAPKAASSKSAARKTATTKGAATKATSRQPVVETSSSPANGTP